MSDRFEPTTTPPDNPTGDDHGNSDDGDIRDRFIDGYLREMVGLESVPDLRDRILNAASRHQRLTLLAGGASAEEIRELEQGETVMPSQTTTHSSPSIGWWFISTTAAAIAILAILSAVLLLEPVGDPHDPPGGNQAADDGDANVDDQPDPQPQDDGQDDGHDTRGLDKPLVVHNRIVNPLTGETLRTLDGVDSYGPARPVPGRPGWFRNGPHWIDAEKQEVAHTEGDADLPWLLVTHGMRYGVRGDNIVGQSLERPGVDLFAVPVAGSVRQMSEMAGCVVAHVFEPDQSIFLNPADGTVRWTVSDRVNAAAIIGDELIVGENPLISQESGFIARYAKDGTERWSHEVELGTFTGGMALLPLAGAGGDIVMLRWCSIADSGVIVERLTSSGRPRWTNTCENLAVPHSRYAQNAYAVQRHGRLLIVSQATGGWFIEHLGVASGSRLARIVNGKKAEIEDGGATRHALANPGGNDAGDDWKEDKFPKHPLVVRTWFGRKVALYDTDGNRPILSTTGNRLVGKDDKFKFRGREHLVLEVDTTKRTVTYADVITEARYTIGDR